MSMNILILAFQNRLTQMVFIYSVTGSSHPKQAELSKKYFFVKTKTEKNHKIHKDNMSFQEDSPSVCLLWLSSSSALVKRPGNGLYFFTNKIKFQIYFICLQTQHVVISEYHNHYRVMQHCSCISLEFS